jgi:hypothetical protein
MGEVGPALTAEEWATWLGTGYRLGVEFGGFHEGDPVVQMRLGGVGLAGEILPVTDESCHRAAAMALRGQPFGFGRDDVSILREWTRGLRIHERYDGSVDDLGVAVAVERLHSLADRIAALLPPED